MSTSEVQSSQGAAEAITRASQSNLAMAFVALPPDRREEISLFYAFCRLVDDITDEPGFTAEQRSVQLNGWRRALREASADEPPLGAAMRGLIARRELPLAALEEIILGCEMDVAGARYVTWEALRLYCYRVASAVGLVSIEIFGCRDPRAREYAVQLGLALQLTNILRDVGEDLEKGRVYLPTGEMEQFGYTLEDLQARRQTPELVRLMDFQARRAAEFFAKAREALPPGDRLALIAAEIMRAVYQRLLEKMAAGGHRVFERRYRVSRAGKLACIVRETVRARLGWAPSAGPRV